MPHEMRNSREVPATRLRKRQSTGALHDAGAHSL